MNLYGIEKRNTIEGKPLMTGTLDETRDACHIERLHYVTCADVPGYMNEGQSTLHRYNGNYGKGYVRTKPCFYRGRRSTNYMTIEYWVTRADVHKRLTRESELTKMRKQYRSYMVEIHIYDETTDLFFPEYVACTGCSCENAINRAKEVLKMQGYKVMYAVECTLSE